MNAGALVLVAALVAFLVFGVAIFLALLPTIHRVTAALPQ